MLPQPSAYVRIKKKFFNNDMYFCLVCILFCCFHITSQLITDNKNSISKKTISITSEGYDCCIPGVFITYKHERKTRNTLQISWLGFIYQRYKWDFWLNGQSWVHLLFITLYRVSVEFFRSQIYTPSFKKVRV